MTETSFPVVGKKLTEAQWGTIAKSWGSGVIDHGGSPYLLDQVDDVTDQVRINVDTITGKNEALVRGFAHVIDTPKLLTLPAVATETTYEIGLVYDPAGHGTEAGPVVLDVWVAPGSTVSGVVRVVLYRVTRQPSQALSAATRVANRQRISPQITVHGTADLPLTSGVLVDTVARVRATGETWRAALNESTGVIGWVKSDGGTHPDLVAATHEATGSTLMKRTPAGTVYVNTGTNDLDAVNIGWIWENSTGGTTDGASKLVRRGADSNFLVPSTPSHGQHPTPKVYVDGKTWAASDIVSGTLHGLRVRHSQWAYDTAQSGTVYTVSVNSNGQLMRFTSKRADKDEIEPLTADPRRLLTPEVVQYRRRDPETGQVPDGARVEWGYIADDEYAREGGVPELVLTEPDEDGVEQPEGWDDAGLTAAHHKVLQWLAARVDEIDEHLGISTEGAGA